MSTRLLAPASLEPDPSACAATRTSLAVAELLRDLGRKLIERRKRSDLSRTELAKRIGFSYGAVAGAEYGQQARSRRFWELADQALHADGTLLAAADAVSLRRAAAKRTQQDRQRVVNEALRPLAPYRQVQKINRAFADRLSTIAARRRRHPHMVKTAARQMTRVGDELDALTATIHTLLSRPDFNQPDILADLWLTLLTHDPYQSTFLSAVALMELAELRQ